MPKSNQDVFILDCTLRDGSYVIDYKFTTEDTYLICLGLAKAGFSYIEIGHGTGLGSSRNKKNSQGATDEEYIEAAKSAVERTTAKIGMFYIPGIGQMKDIELAAKKGLDFIRIGTNVNEVAQAEECIKLAKSLGLRVSSNLMKSYAVSVDEFVRNALIIDSYGADVIVVVDSAGGMFPEDVRNYVSHLKKETDKEIGFHGHNNLQYAVANTVEAVKAGATVVDSSLQGMGRSAGNAQTEVLVMVLEKIGFKTGIDPYKTMDLGERIIKPMLGKTQGVDDMSLISGIAQFHSSFGRIIEDVSRKYHIDPRLLILEVSEEERISVTYELAEKIAKRIKKKQEGSLKEERDFSIKRDIIKDKVYKDSVEKVHEIIKELTSLSKKTGKETVFSITLSLDHKTTFPYIRQSHSLVISNVEAADIHEAQNLIQAIDGQVHWVLLDESHSSLRDSGLEKEVRLSRFSWYSEQRVIRMSLYALAAQRKIQFPVLILADQTNVDLLKVSLKQQGMDVVGWDEIVKGKRALDSVRTIISFDEEFASQLDGKSAGKISKEAFIFAIRPKSYPTAFWSAVIKNGNFICRVDSRAALASELNMVTETAKMVTAMGFKLLNGIPVVSGGIIGRRGSIVVDSLESPTHVIGVADGEGGILSSDEAEQFKEDRENIQEQIIRNIYQKEY